MRSWMGSAWHSAWHTVSTQLMVVIMMIMIMVIIIIVIINLKTLSLAPRLPLLTPSNGPVSLFSFTIKILLEDHICSLFGTFHFLSPDFPSLQTGFVPIMLLKLLLSRSPMNSILPEIMIKASLTLLSPSSSHLSPWTHFCSRSIFLPWLQRPLTGHPVHLSLHLPSLSFPALFSVHFSRCSCLGLTTWHMTGKSSFLLVALQCMP